MLLKLTCKGPKRNETRQTGGKRWRVGQMVREVWKMKKKRENWNGRRRGGEIEIKRQERSDSKVRNHSPAIETCCKGVQRRKRSKSSEGDCS